MEGVESTVEVGSSPEVESKEPVSVTTPADTAPAAAETEYTPNLKFKVRDEEKEFDPVFAAVVKDAATEQKLRDLYTRAEGLEPLKQRLSSEVEEWKTKFQGVDSQHQGIIGQLDKLSFHARNNDFDTFFDTLQINKGRIYEWVQKKIAEQSMPPEQKAELESQRQMQHRLYELEQQNRKFQSQFESYSEKEMTAHLENQLARPDVQAVQNAYDEKLQSPGAFRTKVIQHGIAMSLQLKREATPDEVINDLMKDFGRIFSTNNAPAAMGAQTGGPAKPPVIPNLGSRGASPVKQVPKSIADLKRIASAM